MAFFSASLKFLSPNSHTVSAVKIQETLNDSISAFWFLLLFPFANLRTVALCFICAAFFLGLSSKKAVQIAHR